MVCLPSNQRILIRCATHRGMRLSPSSGVTLLAPDPIRRGVVDVVSFDELFQFCLVLIGFAALIIQITKKK